MIGFNKKAWVKPYIDMNTKLRKKSKNSFEKDFLKLMNNSVFGKTMENERKIATAERKSSDFLSEPNFHATKFFIENLLSIEMRKTQTRITYTVY